jgi:hypothetical protein
MLIENYFQLFFVQPQAIPLVLESYRENLFPVPKKKKRQGVEYSWLLSSVVELLQTSRTECMTTKNKESGEFTRNQTSPHFVLYLGH